MGGLKKSGRIKKSGRMSSSPDRCSKPLQALPTFAHCQGPVKDKDFLCRCPSHLHSPVILLKDLFCKVDKAGEGEDGDSNKDEEEAKLFVSLTKVVRVDY